MRLKQLELHNIRNIIKTQLTFDDDLNLIIGNNGSGKTTLLEAIHSLSTGKSFRTSTVRQLIQADNSASLIRAEIQTKPNQKPELLSLGLTRNGIKIKHQNEGDIGLARLAELCPVVAIHPRSSEIILGSPDNRRRILDWGAFHVIPEYINYWRDYNNLLKQRNEVLKQGDASWLAALDTQFVKAATQLFHSRLHYLELLIPYIQPFFDWLLEGQAVTLRYKHGWSAQREFQEVLQHAIADDIYRGFTQVGPHRDDLEIRLNHGLANQIASRGQVKLMIYSIYLGQVRCLYAEKEKRPVVLLDDFDSEFDLNSTALVASLLKQIGTQVICTATRNSIEHILKPNKMFHVEHGTVTELV